jgi:hypothetical protein
MATGKTNAKHISVLIDDYADVQRDISASVTDVSIPRTWDQTDVSGYSDGVTNITVGQPNTPLTISGVFDSTLLVGSHTVLSRVAGDIYTARTVIARVGIRAAWAGGDPYHTGVYFCSSLVYSSDMTYVAEFVPATTTAPGWTA